MIKNLKINTAVILCTVFIFRILFVNIGIISSSLNTQQNNNSTKSLSTTIKKGKHFEATNHPGNCDCSLVEICEEDSNNDDQLKLSSLFLSQVLYFSITGEIDNKLKKTFSFSTNHSYKSSDRYITFRTFRI